MPNLRLFLPLLCFFLCHCAVRNERSLREDGGSLGGEVLSESTFDPNAFEKEAKDMVKDMATIRKKLKTEAVKKKQQSPSNEILKKKPSDEILKKLQFFLADPERAKEQLKLFLAQDAATIQEAIKEVMCPKGAGKAERKAASFDAKSFATDLATVLMAWTATLKGKKFSDSEARTNAATAYIFATANEKASAPVGALAAAAIQFLQRSSVLSREAIRSWVAKNYTGKVKEWLTADLNYQTIVAFCQSDDTLGSSIAHAYSNMDPSLIAPIALISLASVVAAVTLVSNIRRRQAMDRKRREAGEQTVPGQDERGPGQEDEDQLQIEEEQRQRQRQQQQQQQQPQEDSSQHEEREQQQQLREEQQQEDKKDTLDEQLKSRASIINDSDSDKNTFGEELKNYSERVKALFDKYKDFVDENGKLKDPEALRKNPKDSIKPLEEDYTELEKQVREALGPKSREEYSLERLENIAKQKGKYKMRDALASFKAQAKESLGSKWKSHLHKKDGNLIKDFSKLYTTLINNYENDLKNTFSKSRIDGKEIFKKSQKELIETSNLSYELYVDHLHARKPLGSHEFYHYLDEMAEKGEKLWEMPVIQSLAKVAAGGIGLSDSSPLLDDLQRLFGHLRRALAKKKRLRPLRYD